MRIWAVTSCLVLAGLFSTCGSSSQGDGSISASKAQELQKRAQGCFLQGDYACAMQGLRTVLKSRPGDAELQNRFAVAARMRYYQSGDMDYRDQELEALRKAVRLAPSVAHIQINFGTTAWELGLRKEAARAYQRGLELAPKHPDAVLMRVRIKRSTVSVEDEDEG